MILRLRRTITLILIDNGYSRRFQSSSYFSAELGLLSFRSRREKWESDDNTISPLLMDNREHLFRQLLCRRVMKSIEREGNASVIVQIRDAGASGTDIEGESTHA